MAKETNTPKELTYIDQLNIKYPYGYFKGAFDRKENGKHWLWLAIVMDMAKTHHCPLSVAAKALRWKRESEATRGCSFPTWVYINEALFQYNAAKNLKAEAAKAKDKETNITQAIEDAAATLSTRYSTASNDDAAAPVIEPSNMS